MIDLDLSKLSVNELIELKKKIDAEQKTRNYTKDYVECSDGAYKDFHKSVFGVFKSHGVDVSWDDKKDNKFRNEYDKVDDIAWKLRSSALFGLCDAAFCNYKRKPDGSVTFVRNGTVIADGIDIEQYKAMYRELVDVFKKYTKGGNNVIIQ